MPVTRRRRQQDESESVLGSNSRPRKRYKIVASTVDELCLRGLQQGRLLGEGDVGKAYAIDDFGSLDVVDIDPEGQYVLKTVEISSREEFTKFTAEVNIGKYMGEIGVGPKIYDSWICCSGNIACTKFTKNNQTRGYYIMDRLTAIYDKEITHCHDNSFVEQQVIDKLTRMLNAPDGYSYIHNDVHPGNIGFNQKNEVVLFDFGFTIKVPYPGEILTKQCLGFLLYQVIEKFKNVPIRGTRCIPMFDSVLYDAIYDIRTGKY